MKRFNFLPEQITNNRSYRRWLILSAILFAGSLIIITAVSLYHIKKYSDLKRKKNLLQKQIQKKSQLLENYRLSRKHYDTYQKLITVTQETRIFPHVYLNIIAQVIPVNVLLTNFSYKLKTKIGLHGIATTTEGITEFLRKLTQEALFKSVLLKHVKFQESAFSYQIEISL